LAYPSLTQEPGAAELAASIRAGALSPLDATEAAIARIEALDGELNAVVVRDFERARDAARALGQRGPAGEQPLFGVPMTVKEAFDVAGLATTWGLPEASYNVAQEDAVVVRRLKAAGAVIVGKTNIATRLADWQSDNAVYGQTRNPHSADRVAGGSSGGSAVALATDMVPLEYGSDIGGSIRVPANFNGVWGHKPTWGLVPLEGHFYPGTEGHDIALGVVGPLARNPRDLRLALELTADHPLADFALPARPRILVVDRHPSAPLDPQIRAAIGDLADRLADAGWIVEHENPLLPDQRTQFDRYIRMLNVALASGGPTNEGGPISAAEWFALLDEQARNQREWRALFAEFDAVIAPSFGSVAFPHSSEGTARRVTIDGVERSQGAQLAWPGLATYPGLPATARPLAVDGEGLPIGIQVICDRWQDRKAIAMAAAIGTAAGLEG
jgi:amidase